MNGFLNYRVRRSALRLLLSLALGLSFSSASFAQYTQIGGNTQTPTPGSGASYLQMLNDVVSPSNGSLSIRMAAPVPKERGNSLPSFIYMYDSSPQFVFVPQWDTVSDGNRLSSFMLDGDPPHGGPSLSTENLISSSLTTYATSGFTDGSTVLFRANSYASGEYSLLSPASLLYPLINCGYYSNYLYNDPNGGRHNLSLTYIVDQSNDGGEGCGTFGVGASWVAGDPNYSASIGSSDGSINSGGQVVIADLHGNAMIVGLGPAQLSSGQGTTNWLSEDTNGNGMYGSGRTAPVLSTSGSTRTLTVPGISGQFQLSSVADGSSYANPGYTIHLNGGSNSLCPAQTATQAPSSSQTGVRSHLSLPNGQQYIFEWNSPFGMSKITYPTGATVSYTWSVIPQILSEFYSDGNDGGCTYLEDAPAITKRVTSYDGVNPAKEEDFAYAASTAQGGDRTTTTTVTTIDLTQSSSTSTQVVYTYDTDWPSAPHGEISIVYKNADGSVAKTVTKAYNQFGPEAAECTTLASGLTSGVFYQYVNGGRLNLKTDVAEYDYGTVSSSCTQPSTTPARETVTTYQSFATTAIYITAPSILDQPASVKVYGYGTLIAETDYGYDEYAVTPVSGALAHDEANYSTSSTSPRGNVTTISKRCLQQCADSVVHLTYDETGQVTSKTDAKGNQTSYSYVDNFTTDDGTAPGNTNTYLTHVTYPTTNGVAHTESFQYDYNKGVLRATTDENGQTTRYYYNDAWNRLTETDYPDSGKATTAYNDSGPNPTVTTTVLLNASGASKTTVAVMNGVGQVIQTKLVSDPSGNDYADSVYDGLGRPIRTSNPYRSTADSSYGVTSLTYDALNRKAVQTQQDGSHLSWCYDDIGTAAQANCKPNVSGLSNVSWVDQADELGNDRQLINDAFGRLIAVVEPNGAVTKYTYDALNNLLSVNQLGVAGDTPRVRQFAYDSLSRLTKACNSEALAAGTSCDGSHWSTIYTYDPNGNVLSKTDSRGVTVSYTYDALNRVATKTYAGSSSAATAIATSTPPVTYNYDVVSGSTIPNAVGHLVSEFTGTSASPISQRFILSYDAMGRIVQDQQCPYASACTGNTPFVFNYTYDYAGNVTSSNNGVPYMGIGLTYQYDSAARLQSVLSTWDDATHPATLFAAPASADQQYSAVGLNNSWIGIPASSQQPTITQQRTYNNRLQLATEGYTSTIGAESSVAVGSTGTLKLLSSSVVGTGNITIAGGTGGYTGSLSNANNSMTLCFAQITCENPIPDTGDITVRLWNDTDNYNTTIHYSGQDASTLATSLSNALNTASQGHAPVVISTLSQGSILSLSALTPGSSSNYGVEMTVVDGSGNSTEYYSVLEGGLTPDRYQQPVQIVVIS